jgi:ribosomal protein S3AE
MSNDKAAGQQPLKARVQKHVSSEACAMAKEHGITRDQAERLIRKYRRRTDELRAAIEVLKGR